MHYYQFHIGDYRAATAHLSNEEDLAYRRLLDMYYDSEQFIPLDTHWVSRRLRVASEVIENVLFDFFSKTENGWQHTKCDELIADYQAMAEKNRINGRKGGRKKNPMGSQSDTERYPNAKPTKNHKPETINQEPIYIEPKGSMSEPNKEPKGSMSEAGLPTCPQQDILNLWKKNLPHLTQPRSWEGSRKTNLRQRWLQAAKPSAYSPDGYKTQEEGLKWWDGFFAYIAKDTSLAKGFESKGRTWLPDLEWVVNATNFQKIIDGKYDK